jgi:hypothetical protein
VQPLSADRGIGGTGAPVIADKGIGGTGVVGVITGFASICAGGVEIGFDAATPLRFDDGASGAASLRAGQVVVASASGGASGGDGGLRAMALLVRHEVSGPVDRVEAEGRRLVVAGQAVQVPDNVWGIRRPRAGEWVQVSGIRPLPDGPVVASRLDRRQPGVVLVHGVLVRDPRGVRIGELAGRLNSLGLHVESIAADAVQIDPGAYFGGDVGRIIIETFVQPAGAGVRLAGGFVVGAVPGLASVAPDRLALVELRRGASGVLTAVSVRDSVAHGPSESGRSGAAPESRPAGPQPGGNRVGGPAAGDPPGPPGGGDPGQGGAPRK